MSKPCSHRQPLDLICDLDLDSMSVKAEAYGALPLGQEFL